MKTLIVGISVRTTNELQQAAKDIPELWNTFLSEAVTSKISNKVNDAIYCIYTNYEKDYTTPYTCIIGVKVNSLEDVPEGMVSLSIESEKYEIFTASSSETVYQEWQKIWNSPLERTYVSDFEIYTSIKEVEIYVGVK